MTAGRESARLIFYGNKLLPHPGVGRAKVLEQRDLGLNPVIYCCVTLGKSPHLSEHVSSSIKCGRLNLLHRVRNEEIIHEKAHRNSNFTSS